MIEHARLNVGTEKRLYQIESARQAIATEARTTMKRVRECRRMAPSQRDRIIRDIESLLPKSQVDATSARLLDELDTLARKVLKHLA